MYPEEVCGIRGIGSSTMQIFPVSDGRTALIATFDDNLEIQADFVVKDGVIRAPGVSYRPISPAVATGAP
jgi:hypothetical protein